MQATRDALRQTRRLQEQAQRQTTQAAREASRAQTQAQREAARAQSQVQRDATREAQRQARETQRAQQRASDEATRTAQRNARETQRAQERAAREAQRQAEQTARAQQRASDQAARAAQRAAAAAARASQRAADEALRQIERERRARERLRREQVQAGRAAASQLGDQGSRAATMGGLAIAGGLAASTREAVKWETAFTGVTKTVNATESQLQGLSKELRNMALQIPVNADELAGIAESAGQLGIEFQNLKGFTETIAALSVSTNLTSEEGATSMAKFANVTKIAQTEFSNLGSSLVDLGNNFATTERDIMEMSQRLSSSGTLIGLKAPQILAFATALSSVGINAEAGGTAFSRSFAIIDTAVRGGGAELEKFAKIAKVSSKDFQKQFKTDAGGAILEFIRGLGKVKAAGGNLDTTLKDLGMKNQYILNAMKSLANNPELLARALNKSSTAWRENTALAEEAGKRYKTSASQIQLSQNNLREFGIIVGTTIVPTLVELLNSIKPAFEWFRSLDKEQQANYVRMTALAGATLLLAGRIKPLVDTVMLARTAFIGLRAAWAGAVAAGGPLGGLLTSLGAVAFPALVIAAGAATVAVGLWAIANEKGKESAARLEAANAGLDASAKMVGKSFDKLKTAAAVNPQAAQQVKALREQYEKLSGTAEGLKKFKQILADAKGQITVGVKGAQKAAIDKEINRLQRDVDRSIGERNFKAEVTAEANRGTLEKVKEAFMQTFGALYAGWKSNFVDPYVALGKWGWGQISYTASESWRGIKIGWKSMTGYLKTAWYEVTGGFDSSMNQMLRKIADSVTGLMGRMINSIKNTWNNFKRWYTGQSANYGETEANAPSIPAYAVGSQNVPKTEVALVHKGEMIIPAEQAAEIRAGRAQPGGRGGSPRDRGNPYVLAARSMMGATGRSHRATGAAYGKEWCVGFLGQVNKMVTGDALANGTLSVSGLRAWGRKTGRAYRGRPRVGDYVTIKGYGKTKSHGALVSRVNNDGTFNTIGGNEGAKNNYRSRVKEGNRYRWNHQGVVFVRSSPVKGGRGGAPMPEAFDVDGSPGSYGGYKEAKKPYIPPYIVAKREADATLGQARREEADAIKLHAQQLEFATKNGVGPSLDAFTARLEKINSLWRDKDSPVVKLFEQKQFGSANKAFAQLMGEYDAGTVRKNQLQQLAELQEQNRKIEDERRAEADRAREATKQREDARDSLLNAGKSESGDLGQREKWALEGKSLEEINGLLEEQTRWRERVAQLQSAGWDRTNAESIANEAAAMDAYNRALKSKLDAEEEALARAPELYAEAIGKLPTLADLVAKGSQVLGDAMHSGSDNAQEVRDALAALPPTLVEVMTAMEAAGPAADKAREKYADFFKLLTDANAEIGRREQATADELTRPYREATARLDELDAELDDRLRRMGAYDFKDVRRLDIQADMKRDGLPDDPARVEKIIKREEWVSQLESVTGSMHSIFRDAFRDTQDGFKGMFDNIFGGFQKMLQNMAAEYLANWVMQQLFGAFMGSIGGGPKMGGGSGVSLSGGGGAGGSSGGFMGGGTGLGSGFSLRRPNGAFAVGLDEVPWDGFVGTLHRGEAVLNRQAADAWRAQQSERDAGLIGAAGRSSMRGAPLGQSGGDTIININGPMTVKSDKPERFAGDLASGLPKREMRRRGRGALGI